MGIDIITGRNVADRLYLDVMFSSVLKNIPQAEIISPERNNKLCMISGPNWSFTSFVTDEAML